MASFNLTDNAWIPVIMLSGKNSRLSLSGLFEKAHEIREVYCDSPLETISLNRFLQALLIRIYEVNEEDKWFNLWKTGSFDIAPAKAYFQKWYNRFDIFDKERPFYQSISTLSKDITAFSKLRHEDSSANNATLFDHTYDSKDYVVPVWRIPIILIAAQAYSVGGGISKPFNFSGAPLIGGCTFWIKEKTLLKSLMLNTDYENMYLKTGSTCEWERPHPVKCICRVSEDYLDYLTWQSRSITFKYDNPDSFDENNNMVFGENKALMYFHQGDKLEIEFDDPLMAKRATKDKVLSIRFDIEKALWRHAEVLFQHSKESGERTSKNVSFLADKYNELSYDIGHFFEIEAYGLLNDQAKVVLRKKETLPFFPTIMKKGNENSVSRFIELAEKQAKILYYALETLGKFILYPSKDESSSLSKDERDDIKRFGKSLSVEKNYWASLEALFISYLQKIAATTFNSWEEHNIFIQGIAKEIYKTAQIAFDNSTRNFDTNAKHLRAITLSKQKLYPINLNGDKNG